MSLLDFVSSFWNNLFPLCRELSGNISVGGVTNILLNKNMKKYFQLKLKREFKISNYTNKGTIILLILFNCHKFHKQIIHFYLEGKSILQFKE